MISYKERLVKFVKLKRAHIKKFGFVYTDHKDYDDLRSWPEEKCREIYDIIVLKIMGDFESRGLSYYTCPWCVYYRSNCVSCYYGKRYGICATSKSAYEIYNTREVRESFTNEVYRGIIYKIINYKL